MACMINITSVRGSGAPGALSTFVVVTGTATDCASVRVIITCGPDDAIRASNTGLVRGDTTWEVKVFNVPCPCGSDITVEAHCETEPSCSARLPRAPLLCDPPPSPECPTITDVRAMVGDCTDGMRSVTLDATVTPADARTDVYHWDFGDGSMSAPVFPGTISPPPHMYAVPGPYIARLIVDRPAVRPPCPPGEVTVGPLEPCPTPTCPTIIFDTPPRVDGCAGGGGRATVTFTGRLTTPMTGCHFRWNFGDLTPVVETAAPSATHSYSEPGTYSVAVAVICGERCIEPVSVSVTVDSCCSRLTRTTRTTISGCADGAGRSATVTVLVETEPPAAPGAYGWNFGDGPTIETSVPMATHTYSTPGPRTVNVIYVPSRDGCLKSDLSIPIMVPACGEPPRESPSPLCGVITYIIAALLGLLLSVGVLILNLVVCHHVTVPPYLWGVLIGLGIALAVTIALSYILCAFGTCPCLNECDWLQIAWMAGLIAAITALYLAGCCSGTARTLWLLMVAGLFAAAGTTFVVWLVQCRPSPCDVLFALSVAFVSGLGTTLLYIPLYPPVAVCGWTWVRVASGTLGALLLIAYVPCRAAKRT